MYSLSEQHTMREPPAANIAATVREHDVHLGGLIQVNPLAVIVIDDHDRVQMCNPAFEKMFGYREPDIIGQPINPLIVPAENQHEAEALSRLGFAGQTADSITRRRRKDGTIIDVELTVVPLSRGGTSIGAYGIFRDLTEQKHAERHLRAQYAVVEALAHSATIEEAAPWVLRAVAEAVNWQAGVMWLVDRTADRLRCLDLWCAPDLSAAQFEQETREGRFARSVGPGRTWETEKPAWIVDVTRETRFSRRDAAAAAGLHAAFSFPMILGGEVLGVVEFLSSAVLEPDDSILRMFAALGRQLGAFIGRSRAQEQVEGFFTMSQDLLCFAGFDGYFKRVNPSWQRVLGYTPEELLAEPHVNLVHLEDRDATIAQFAALRAGGLMNGFENRYRCTDGSYKWLIWTAIAKPGEEIIYAVARDNTERKLIEQQTQDTLRMRNDFVSFVTHQLRTPLSGIKWMLELAAETGDGDEKNSYVQDAHESADRLIGLVNDLLDASRLESGKLRVVLEPVNLRSLTEAVLNDVTTLVREKGHTVTVEAAGDLPDVTSDRQLLRQVVMNLLSNAIKYTPTGGRIHVRMDLDGRNLRWAISDSGIGIPKAAASRLFEKFYRADNVHTVDTEGTGLGLYLVRLIVERFGGTITCESEEGQGTTFAFTLPRAGVST
jgi:PAS domain S-box-containing protein